jgi:hypothetical protein
MQYQVSPSPIKTSLDVKWKKDLASDYEFCIVFPADEGKFTTKGSVSILMQISNLQYLKCYYQ